MKGKIIISKDTAVAFDKIEYPFMTKKHSTKYEQMGTSLI